MRRNKLRWRKLCRNVNSIMDSLLNVKVSLKKNLRFWRSIGAPKFILTTIEKGYKSVPFASFPLSVKLRNNNSQRLHADFVDQAVFELINSGRVSKLIRQAFAVSPLSVSMRLILDLRHVNRSFIKQESNIRIASRYGLFFQDSYMFSFDFKSGYHHMDIAQEHQTFLGFSCKDPDSNNEVFYVFTVLPFGLSTAAYIFTKLLKPVEKHWRLQGTCIATFLDDGWPTVRDKRVATLRPTL